MGEVDSMREIEASRGEPPEVLVKRVVSVDLEANPVTVHDTESRTK